MGIKLSKEGLEALKAAKKAKKEEVDMNPKSAPATENVYPSVHIPAKRMKLELRPEGLWHIKEDGAFKICRSFTIEAAIRNFDSDSWGIRLGWLNKDNEQKYHNILRADMIGGTEMLKQLAGKGFPLNVANKEAREDFLSFVCNVSSRKTARIVDRLGQHGDDLAKAEFEFLFAGGWLG